MPRVLIVNAYSRRNRGDGMIVSQMVRLFQARGCEVRVMSDDPSDGDHYGVPRVEPLMPSWPQPGRRDSAARSALGVGRAWLPTRRPPESIAWADICVSAGGGYLYDDGGRSSRLNIIRRLVPLRAARRAGKPVVLFNQSIGPFQSDRWARFVGRELRRLDLVIAREQLSYDVCQRLGISRLELCDDIAFALEPAGDGPAPRSAVGVTVMNSLPGHGSQTYDAYRAALRDGLVAGTRARDTEVVVISQVATQPRDDDTRAAKELTNDLENAGVPVSYVNLADAMESDVAAYYGGLTSVVASRLHSGILALCGGTPIVGLSYLPKTDGVLARFGGDLPVLPAAGLDSARLAQAIAHTLDRHDALKATVQARLREARERAIRGIDVTLGVLNA